MAHEAAEPVPDERTQREIALEEAAERRVAPGYMNDIREFDCEAERRRLGVDH